METKELICTVCPQGCRIKAQVDDGVVTDISGNWCKRGEHYAITELTDPRRTLTTTMRVKGGGLVSVKSKEALPKDKLLECMKAVNAVQAAAPVEIGDVLIKDVLGLGVDIVATSRFSGV